MDWVQVIAHCDLALLDGNEIIHLVHRQRRDRRDINIKQRQSANIYSVIAVTGKKEQINAQGEQLMLCSVPIYA